MDFNKLEHLIRKCSHVGSKYRFQINRKDNKIVYSVEAPAGNYMSNVNNRNPRTKCEICSKLTIKALVYLLLILNIFHTLL